MWPTLLAVVLALLPPPRSLLVTTQEGVLMTVDVSTGTTQKSPLAGLGATDVLADGASAAWVFAPGDEAPGRLSHVTLVGASVVVDDFVTAGGLDGRVLMAGSAPLVLGLAEGATLSRVVAGGLSGITWPLPASALITRRHGVLAVATLDDASVPWSIHHGVLDEDGVHATSSEPQRTPHSPCGGRLVETAEGVTLVWADAGVVALTLPDGTHRRARVSGAACVEDAVALVDGSVVALVGPSPAVVSLGGEGPDASRQVALPAATLTHVPWVSHRLAHDDARHRTWVAAGSALLDIDLAHESVVRALPVPATALALIDR